MTIASHQYDSTSSIVLLLHHHVGRQRVILRLIRCTSAHESANAGASDHQEQRRRLRLQRRGDIDQTYQPRPWAETILRIGRWHCRSQQQNAEHAHQLQIQRRHK